MTTATATAPLEAPRTERGIRSKDHTEHRRQLIEMLKKAYWMEIETVMSYIANSVNPDGLKAREISEALEEDIEEELDHARRFAARIKELWGTVPGSLQFRASQKALQPPEDPVDVIHVVKGVIQAERGAIDHYNQIVEFCEGVDPVTQDLVIEILHDEEGHLRLFEGFLRELAPEAL